MLQLIHDVLHALDHAPPAVEERTARLSLSLQRRTESYLPMRSVGSRQTSLITGHCVADPLPPLSVDLASCQPEAYLRNIWIDVRGCFKPMAKLPTAFLAQANCIQANPAQKKPTSCRRVRQNRLPGAEGPPEAS